MGSVVKFGKQSTVPAPALPPGDIQDVLARDSVRINDAISSCAVLLSCIDSLQKSLDKIDELQCNFSADDGQSVEEQSLSIRSKLASQIASIEGIVRAMGDAAAQVSQIGASLRRTVAVKG